MPVFCTTTSFIDILVDTDMDDKTTKLLSKKISLSENTIKSRLSKRYDVSSFDSATAIPPQLRDLCELLTEGFYYKSSSRGNEKALKRGMTICKMALDELKMIADGEVNLLNTAGTSIVERDSGQWDMTSSSIDYSTTFNEDDSKNWRIDSDKLSDISDGRS